MKCLCYAALFFLYLASNAIAEEARIFMDAYINGQPVKLAFDTGAEGPVLFRQAANRLNLSIKEPPDDVTVERGKVKFGRTEKCKFRLVKGGPESNLTFGVVDIPGYFKAGFDGLLGWGVVKNLMVEIDSSSRKVGIRESLNFDKAKWKCLDIRTDLNILVVKTPSDDTTQDCFLIDTGDPGGLTVRKELWRQLAGDEAGQNTTLMSIYSPGFGLRVNKEIWIREIDFGGLPLHEIPVTMGMEANPAMMKEGIDGILGMWGLSCYSWIVDGPSGKIYFRKNDFKRIPEKYEYNRLGAVFTPKDIQTDNALIAHVIKGGPAYTAGVRDGDELLRIRKLDVTKWRTDPNVIPLGRFWSMPAGTKMDLVLLRDSKTKGITVTLEEIFK